MKREICWLVLLLAAMLVRLLPTGDVGISWPVGRFTHRGASFNEVICWTLLITLAFWIFTDLVQQFRRGR